MYHSVWSSEVGFPLQWVPRFLWHKCSGLFCAETLTLKTYQYVSEEPHTLAKQILIAVKLEVNQKEAQIHVQTVNKIYLDRVEN